MKYKVIGTTTIECELEVDAETAEEAEDIIRNNAYPVEYVHNTVGIKAPVEADVICLSASNDIDVEEQYTEEC